MFFWVVSFYFITLETQLIFIKERFKIHFNSLKRPLLAYKWSKPLKLLYSLETFIMPHLVNKNASEISLKSLILLNGL